MQNLNKNNFLFNSISSVKGVGLKLKKYLKNKKIEKVKDLLLDLPYEVTNRSKIFDLNELEKDGMITIVGGETILTPLQETNMELKPEELDNAKLYQQLCYLATICQTKGASKVSAILSQSSGNIKADELKKIVPLLIKSYRLQINKNQTLDDSEQEELKILETISDTWGGTKIEGSLDGFI